MENLEEVLQALDEFQKMRPTVIPQELEDYLCWVAKTGDPIYQWSLIKTLFREKLTRVMTDFYESCPTLELAPCPNVEHFNYDTMKSNLLERLESFANAPFTVQRICELLTAPRKEYNRVDKFMRAIEKNILVVSTREPGPIARRGETGDGMVNGSVEEDTASVTQQQQQQQPPPPPSPSLSPSQQSSQSPPQPPLQPQTTQSVQPTSQEVDMEYWEKDCSSTVTISVHSVDNSEPPLMHNVISSVASPVGKTAFNADESNQREKLEASAACRTETTTSNFISATSEFSTMSSLPPQMQSHESVQSAPAVPVVQSLPTAVGMVTEDSPVAADDAVMNQDIGSQSGLSLENEENESATTATATTTTTTTATTTTTVAVATTATSISTTSTATTTVTVVATVIPLTTDTTRKLQAAFQAKRFDSGDSKCLDKSDEKAPTSPSTIAVEEEIGHSMKNGETVLTKPNSECMDSNEMSCNESRLNENLLQTDVEMKSEILPSNADNVTEERTPSESQEGGTTILEDVDDEDLHCSKSENTKTAFVESQTLEKDSAVMSDECAVIVSSSDALYRTEKTEIHSKGTPASISSKESFLHDQTAVSQEAQSMEVTDKDSEAVPRVISSKSNDEEQEAEDSESNADNLKMEITNGKTTDLGESISDSISVVQKAKEPISVIEKLESVSTVVEMTENVDNSVGCHSPKSDKLITSIQDESLANVQGDKATECIAIQGNQSSVIESVASRKEHESELMEVDDEEPTFQQDEQMEHEAMEESKS